MTLQQQQAGAFPAIPNMPAVTRILSRFDRPHLEGFIAVALDLIDTLDGDSDLEEIKLEDAFVEHDPMYASDHPGVADAAFIEWHTKGAKARRAHYETLAGDHEDDEEDDPAGVHDEDGINTLNRAYRDQGPGCRISDEGGCEHDGREEEQGYAALRLGLDQSRPISDDNPVML